MTKTIKKGFLVSLLLVVAILAGVASTAFIGRSYAVEQTDAEKFIGYMNQFEKTETFDDTILVENDNNKALWQAYHSAKILYSKVNSIEGDENLTKALKKFDEADEFFNSEEAYNHVAQILNTMYEIAMNPHVNYTESKAAVDALDKVLFSGTEEKINEKWLPFIRTLTNEYEYFYRTKAFLAKVAEYFTEIDAKIGEIKYYDTSDKTMKKGTGAATEFIVLDSESGVKTAEELIKTLTETGRKIEYTISDTSSSHDGDSFSLDKVVVRKEDITGALKGDKYEGGFATKYNELAEARTTVNKYRDMAEDVIVKIHNVYDKIVDKKMYYTLRDLIDGKENGCSTAYNALLGGWTKDGNGEYNFDPETAKYAAYDSTGETNYNDMQKIVNEAKLDAPATCPEDKQAAHKAKTAAGEAGALKEMLDYLAALDTNIEAAETAITTLESAKEGRKYNKEYKKAIDDARTAVDKLDADVKAWDKDKYNADQKTPEYSATPDAYGTQFPEYEGKAYIVAKYDVLEEAEAQWAQWNKEIDDLVARVKAMVGKYEKEPHEPFQKDYTDILDEKEKLTTEQQTAFEKAYKPTATSDTEADQNRKIEVSSTFRQDGDETGLYEGTYTPKEVLDSFASTVAAIYAKIGNLGTKIDNLYKKCGEAEMTNCVFAYRQELIGIWLEYYMLNALEQTYVSSASKLDAMWTEYQAELELVKAWRTFVEDETEGTGFGKITLPVTVNNLETIKAAVEKFAALIHNEEVLADVLGKLQTAVSLDEYIYDAEGDKNDYPIKDKVEDFKTNEITGKKTLKDNYDNYKKIVDAYNTLVKAIADLDTAMKAIDVSGTLDLATALTWAENVTKVKGDFEALAENLVTEEWMEANHAEAWANYEKALDLFDRYNVERLINDLYDKSNLTDYETNAQQLIDDKKITLKEACVSAVNTADEAYKAYAEKVTDEVAKKNVRNYTKLEAAKKALDMITEELNAWRRNVVKLYTADFAEDADNKTIEDALAKASEFVGYPLDLDEYNKLAAEYTTLTSGKDDETDRIAFLKTAKAAFDALKAKSDEVITGLEEEIQDLLTTYADSDSITPEDLERVEQVKNTYDKLHESQQKEVDRYDEFKTLVDKLIATEAFKNMLAELYKDVVTNENVTSLTAYYIGVVEAIYDQFTPEVKATFKDYNEKMNAIKEAYETAVEEGTVLSLKDIDEKLNETVAGAADELKEELINAFKGADGKATDIEGAIEEFKTGITNAYNAAIEAAKKELQGKLDTLQGQVEALEQAKTTLEGKDTELEGKITKAQQELQQAIDNAKKALETADTEMGKRLKTLEDANNALQGKLDALETKIKDAYEKAIEAAKKELQGKLDTLQGQVEALEQAKTTLEGKDTELEGKITKAQQELQELQQTIETAKKALETADTEMGKRLKTLEDANNALQGKLDALETKIKDAYGKAIEAAKNELQGKLDTLTGQVEALEQAKTTLEGKDTELEGKITKAQQELQQAIETAKKALETADTEMGKRLKTLEDANNALQGKLDALETKIKDAYGKAIEAAKNELQGKIDDAKTEAKNAAQADLNTEKGKLEDAIKKAEETLRGEIKSENGTLNTELLNQIDKAKAELEDSIKALQGRVDELESKMNAADADLQSKIDSLNSTATTLTVLVIVIGVLLLGAGACIVVLFVKRKKD